MTNINVINKITKMLSLAFKNANKEEATNAFRQAYSLMQRERVTYEELFNVEIYEGANPSTNSSQREAELVEKYNALLIRARELKADVERAKTASASSSELVKVKEKLDDAHNQIYNQASEIVRLRETLKCNKYNLRDVCVWCAIGAVASLLTGMNITSKKIEYIERPVPVAASTAPTPSPVSTAAPQVTPANSIIDTLATQPPVSAPEAIKRWTLAYGARNAKGMIVPLVITQYSDGTIKDNTGEEYNKPGERVFYSNNDYQFSINGNEFIVDNTPVNIAAAYLPQKIKSDLNQAAANGCKIYLTSYDAKLMSLATCKNKLFFNDINNYGEVKKYTYDSINEAGEMKYTKDGSATRYVTLSGANLYSMDNSSTNLIYSFRGNAVKAYN